MIDYSLFKYRNNPEGFIRLVIGIKELEEEQLKVINAVLKYGRIAVRSGHGIGKTAVLVFIILWWLCTRVDCRITMTSPSQHQLWDILIPELTKWSTQSPLLNKMVEITATRIWVKGYHDKWFGIARSCKKGENIAGTHNKNLLVVIEEASGVDQGVIDTLEGSLTGEGNKLIMIGNPTQLSGAFHRAFYEDRDLYKTFTFNAENSKLVSKQYIKRMARYGTDSDIYRVRVLGLFPKGEPDTFIRLDLVEQSVLRDIQESWELVSIGVDPARFGDDESVIFWRKGLDIQPCRTFNGIDTVRLAGEVIRLTKEIYRYNRIKIAVKVDDTGIGGGVTDNLNKELELELRKTEDDREFNIEVVPVINNGTATDPDYKDYGSQMWGEMKDALETMKVPNDDILIAQLTTRKYKVEPDGKVKLESKKEMKKRHLPSPDRADALALCLANLNYFDFSGDKVESEARNE